MTVSDGFVENMLFVPDSAVPAPIAEPIGAGRLDWQFPFVPSAEVGVAGESTATELD